MGGGGAEGARDVSALYPARFRAQSVGGWGALEGADRLKFNSTLARYLQAGARHGTRGVADVTCGGCDMDMACMGGCRVASCTRYARTRGQNIRRRTDLSVGVVMRGDMERSKSSGKIGEVDRVRLVGKNDDVVVGRAGVAHLPTGLARGVVRGMGGRPGPNTSDIVGELTIAALPTVDTRRSAIKSCQERQPVATAAESYPRKSRSPEQQTSSCTGPP